MRESWRRDIVDAACVGALFALFLIASGCGGVSIPPPPGLGQPATPANVCIGEGKTDCYVEPTRGNWMYVCALKDASGNVTGTALAKLPSLCPQPVVPVPVTPPPGPVAGKCPATCPAGAKTMNARCIQWNPQTGKCVTDSTPRCGDIGDGQGYCGIVTGNPGIRSCKANPEGSGLSACDAQWLGAACPYWFGSVDGGLSWFRALPDGIDANGNPRSGGTPVSIDHLEGWSDTDGVPYTGQCPKASFGLQAPIAGFGGVPHGRGLIKACDAAGIVCSLPIATDY